MADIDTPMMRAVVVASLLLATATLMVVAVNTARAAGALVVGACTQNGTLAVCYRHGGKEWRTYRQHAEDNQQNAPDD